MREIILNWEGPYNFKELICSNKLKNKYSCSGIYIWLFINEEKSEVLYIGKTTGSPTLFERQIQHYMFYIGGLYKIPKEYRNIKKEWNFDIKLNEVKDTIINLEKFCNIIRDGFNFANNEKFKIYFCRKDSSEVASIERQLLYDFKPKLTKWGTVTLPKDEIKILNKNLPLKKV
ncbi:MAG: hypothetical protein ACFFDN_49570 [Candidatus Hodarchaeota archaeon]